MHIDELSKIRRRLRAARAAVEKTRDDLRVNLRALDSGEAHEKLTEPFRKHRKSELRAEALAGVRADVTEALQQARTVAAYGKELNDPDAWLRKARFAPDPMPAPVFSDYAPEYEKAAAQLQVATINETRLLREQMTRVASLMIVQHATPARLAELAADAVTNNTPAVLALIRNEHDARVHGNRYQSPDEQAAVGAAVTAAVRDIPRPKAHADASMLCEETVNDARGVSDAWHELATGDEQRGSMRESVEMVRKFTEEFGEVEGPQQYARWRAEQRREQERAATKRASKEVRSAAGEREGPEPPPTPPTDSAA
jgi:hypothetical protein